MSSPDDIDTLGEYAELFVFVVVALGIGLIAGAYWLSTHPTVDERILHEVETALHGPPQYANGTVAFTQAQVYGVNGLNAVYRHSDEEFAWCLEINDGHVALNHPKELNNVTEGHIAFVCSGSTNGILHTHPGHFAVPELSTLDKQNLHNSSLDVSCVMSDPVPEDIRRNPVSLQCFNRNLTQVPVQITTDAS